MNQIPVKWIVGILLGVAAIALLTYQPPSRVPRDRIVVQYWEKWTGREAEQMKEIVNDFNETVGKTSNPPIWVDYLSMSKIDQKTLIATTAGVPPDIAGIWDGQIAQFAAMDALEPLDDLASEYGITEGYYKTVYWNACKYEGTLYGLISTPAAVALHYNKKLMLESAEALRSAGLDPNRPPRTIDELDRYSSALVLRDPKGQIIRLGHAPMEPGWYIIYAPIWFGGKLYDEKTRKLTLTSPQCVAAYRWIQSYAKELGKDALSDFRSGLGQFASAQNPFLIGQVVMEQQGPWMSNYIDDLNPKMNRWKFQDKSKEAGMSRDERRANYEWGASEFPSVYAKADQSDEERLKNGVTYCGFDVLAIPRNAKHRKEAFKFIAFVNRLDVMEKLCSMHCKNTPLTKTSDTWERNHPNPYVGVFDALASSPHAAAVPSIPVWPEVGKELGDLVQRLTLMKTDPETGLREAQERLQPKIDQYFERAERRKREGK